MSEKGGARAPPFSVAASVRGKDVHSTAQGKNVAAWHFLIWVK
jgi:hypothetical protein